MSDTSDPIPEVADLSVSDTTTDEKSQVISGRRYNAEEDVDYMLPNDDPEADRLHKQHNAIKYSCGGNFRAPVKELLEEGIQVVDAGCGPAAWTFDMAKDYPNSQFTGVDISFVASDTARPDNVDFKNANITKEIPFEDNSVDYYFQRFLVAGLNKEDMKAALKNAYRVVKPGGHIEIGEALIETVENTGPRYTPVRNMMAAVLKKKGLSPDIGLEIGDFLTEVGFENVHFDKKTVPVNHTNRAGELWWGDFAELFRSIRPVVAMSIPAYEDPEVYEGFIQAVKEECAEYKTNAIFCFAYGQKPLEESA